MTTQLGTITLTIVRDESDNIIVSDDKTICYGVGDDLQDALECYGDDCYWRQAASANYDDPDSLRVMGWSDKDKLTE